jgi:hypothetical protein
MAKPTKKELATIAKHSDFIDRVAVCVVFYARYILGEAANTALHRSRVQWAQSAIQNPSAANGLLIRIAHEFENVDPWNTDPASISDASLQTAVETVINSTFLVF